MKKILLLSLFILCTLSCYAQKNKSFYYDGVELHNVKGWTIVPAKDASVTTITCLRLPFQLQIQKKGLPQDFNAQRYLEETIEQLMEITMMSTGKSPKIKEVSEPMDGYINSIPAKYVDITYTKKVVQRHYVFAMHDQLFVIQCTGFGNMKSAMAYIDRVLSTFTYNPETSPYGALM
mgnify:FL=1